MSDSVPTKKGKASSSKDAGAATAAAAADAATSASSCVAAAAPPSGGGAVGSASADALLDLLASKIDYLEGNSSGAADESSLTSAEVAAVTAKFSALQTQLDGEAAEGKAPADQLAMLLDLYRSEVQSRMVLARQLNDTKEKLMRAANQKRSLEQLCRELQNRNKTMSSDLKALSHEQNKQHLEMKHKFELNLKDIQTQLNRHSEERMAQQKENDKLRENLAQLLKFDSMREEHFLQQLKTKELEAKLLEAKLAQQSDFAVAENKKSKEQQSQIEYLRALESNLREQLSGYAQKFENVQSTLSKSNELFGTFKAEMEKSSAAMKKSEKEKAALEQKLGAAQLSCIRMHEERQAERADVDKLQRQNAVLASLCKELKAKSAAAATATAAAAVAATTTVAAPAEEQTAAVETPSAEITASS